MKFLLSLSLKVKIIIAACAVTAATVVGTVIVMNAEEAYRVIKVFEVSGSAVVTRENTGDIEAYAGMNLESGDILSVNKDSTLRISLDSDKYILLDAGTVIKLIAQGTEADSKTVIDLEEGAILNEIRHSLSANSSYEVNTPKATMAVRGTIFKVSTIMNENGDYITVVETSEGRVSVRLFDENGNLKDDEADVAAGKGVTIFTEANSTTGNPAGVDGESYFVFKDENGNFEKCSGNDAVYSLNETYSAEKSEQMPADTSSAAVRTETVSETDVTSEADKSDTTVLAVMAEAEYPADTSPETAKQSIKPGTKAATQVITTTIPDTMTTIPGVTTIIPNTTTATPGTTTATTTVSTTTTVATTTTVSAATTSANTTAPAVTTMPTIPTTPSIPTSSAVTTSPEMTAVTTATVLTVTTEPETTASEEMTISEETTVSEETTESVTETEHPAAYRVSFIDENGNVISTSEITENETLGALPQVSNKKGYTGKWVNGGEEVTADTVITGDMNITAEYSAMPVTIQVYVAIYNQPSLQPQSVITFTVDYDSTLTENENGYTTDSLASYIQSNCTDYFDSAGMATYTYRLNDVTFGGGDKGTASDSSVISGDHVAGEGSTLSASIYFSYELINGTTSY